MVGIETATKPQAAELRDEEYDFRAYCVNIFSSLILHPFPQPAFVNSQNVFDLLLSQHLPTWNVVPFFEAAAAAGGCGVLGDENRMPAHRRLSAIILRRLRRQPLFDELPPMFQDHRQRFFGEIRLLLCPQSESAAKLAAGQRREQVVKIAHVFRR
jgi:hypothetical protein